MLMSIFWLLQFSIMSSIFTMILQRKHLLMSLLALEMMILSFILLIATSLMKNNPDDTMILLAILTFGACEASIGLACLVNLIRLMGNDLIKSLNSNKC